MRAFAIDAFGEAGSIRELPDPVPGDGEVLVRVNVAGMNATDIFVMAGFMKDYVEHRFPLVIGIDASGVVERVGAESRPIARAMRSTASSASSLWAKGRWPTSSASGSAASPQAAHDHVGGSGRRGALGAHCCSGGRGRRAPPRRSARAARRDRRRRQLRRNSLPSAASRSSRSP